MVFRLPFALNIEGWILKGSLPVNGSWKGVQPPRHPCNLGIQWPHPHNLASSWDISLAVKPDIVSIPGANMQWGRFICHSCSQLKEGTNCIWIVLWSTWELSSPGKQVAEVVLHVRKGAKFGVQKVNGGQDICCRYASVGDGKIFEKQAQSSKG